MAGPEAMNWIVPAQAAFEVDDDGQGALCEMGLDEKKPKCGHENDTVQSGAVNPFPQDGSQFPIGCSDDAPAAFVEAYEVIGKQTGTDGKENPDQQACAQLGARGYKDFPQPETKKDIGQHC